MAKSPFEGGLKRFRAIAGGKSSGSAGRIRLTVHLGSFPAALLLATLVKLWRRNIDGRLAFRKVKASIPSPGEIFRREIKTA
jgi:hypothetical protein